MKPGDAVARVVARAQKILKARLLKRASEWEHLECLVLQLARVVTVDRSDYILFKINYCVHLLFLLITYMSVATSSYPHGIAV